MKHANIVKAFTRLGLAVDQANSRTFRVHSGDRIAEWFGKENVGSIYVSSVKREEEWGHNDGCAGHFFDSITGAISAFESCRGMARLFEIGGRKVEVWVFNNCHAKGKWVEYTSVVKVYPVAGWYRKAIEGGFSDAESIAFLRSCPPDPVLFDWLTDNIPEFEALTQQVAS